MIIKTYLFTSLTAAIAVSFLLLFLSCSQGKQAIGHGIQKDGQYDSEFPSQNTSAPLEQLTKTVRRISSIAFYEGFLFSKESKTTLPEIRQGMAQEKSYRKIAFNNPASGTATTIFMQGKKIAVLTCAHVVNFPDTIITYFKSDEGDSVSYLESFSLKRKQNNFLIDMAEGFGFEVFAIDEKRDLAVLGKELIFPPSKKIPVFNFKIGKADDLKWGSFVYIVGWPKGHQMITSGLVSSPNRDKEHSFLIDALFNRGFSGGLVLAIRDGVPNFELVGIVSSVSATFEYILTPEKGVTVSLYGPQLPYDNDIFVKLDKKIDYGVTFGISVESVLDFLNMNREIFISRGYDPGAFFKQETF
ncbi:MAG: serine protease [Calditrichia bacterium]